MVGLAAYLMRSAPSWNSCAKGEPRKKAGLCRRHNRQHKKPASDLNKLHRIFDKPGRGLNSLVADFGSQEAAFNAIKNATQDAVQQQNISWQYEIEITVHGQNLTVLGTVMSDGTVKIGTIFP